ncbi:MAG: DNA mismatch repair protein MutT [Sphingobacteriia bacterium 39-39-8]|nr:MAG: DNA mismatch repair protein MutT [Sphingobacteriia bacterium 39-39-8]
MPKYQKQTRFLVAVDCIIFGFDGTELKLLLVQRELEPEKGKWSLIGSFIREEEDIEKGANRILNQMTGLEGVYLEQLHAFGKPDRDPIERTISVAYFALIDIHQYERQLNDEYHAEWFPIKSAPRLIFDHEQMVEMAKKRLRYKAAFHPILFELLPEKFTVPQLQNLYEGIFDTVFDKRNFSRKIQSTNLLIKQKDKDKENSKSMRRLVLPNTFLMQPQFAKLLS